MRPSARVSRHSLVSERLPGLFRTSADQGWAVRAALSIRCARISLHVNDVRIRPRPSEAGGPSGQVYQILRVNHQVSRSSSTAAARASGSDSSSTTPAEVASERAPPASSSGPSGTMGNHHGLHEVERARGRRCAQHLVPEPEHREDQAEPEPEPAVDEAATRQRAGDRERGQPLGRAPPQMTVAHEAPALVSPRPGPRPADPAAPASPARGPSAPTSRLRPRRPPISPTG